MRKAAMVLGIVGGVVGLLWTAVLYNFLVREIFGGEGSWTGELAGDPTGWFAFSGIIVCSIAGIVGGALALRHRVASSLLLIVGGLAGSAFLVWAPVGVVLIIGGILVAVSRSKSLAGEQAIPAPDSGAAQVRQPESPTLISPGVEDL
jgi:hypothetical protein